MSESEKLYNELRELSMTVIGIDPEYFTKLFKFPNKYKRLYRQSDKDNFYWEGCSLQVYKNHFKKRLEKFLGEFSDFEKINFIDIEIKDISSFTNYSSMLSNNEKVHYELIRNKKLDYLKGLAKSIEDESPNNAIQPAPNVKRIEEQPYNHKIFASYEGFFFFKKIEENMINKCTPDKDTNQDVNFVYCHIIKDKFLQSTVKPSEFRDWLNEYNPQKYSLSEVRGTMTENKEKEKLYSIFKELIQFKKNGLK